LKKGETIAIIGENGSGKSTLIRLITGMYLPAHGKVTMSGFDTKELTQKALYENTTAVFQKYQKYQMTLEDNITISKNDIEFDKSKLDNICKIAGTNEDDSSFKYRFRSEAVEDDKYMLGAIRYIHNNPVKVGIVKNVLEYQWSSAKDYINEKSDIISCKYLNEVMDLFKDKGESKFNYVQRNSRIM